MYAYFLMAAPPSVINVRKWIPILLYISTSAGKAFLAQNFSQIEKFLTAGTHVNEMPNKSELFYKVYCVPIYLLGVSDDFIIVAVW